MKKYYLLTVLAVMLLGVYLIAADHIDAPAVGSLTSGSGTADITDFYAFESPNNPDNYVFVCNVWALLSPTASAEASFDENVMYEFNIDTNNDNVEDLVIQTIFRDNKVIAFGPSSPTQTGLSGAVMVEADFRVEADVTPYGSQANVVTQNGISLFAGPRDDAFFMDFFKFVDIVNGVGGAENPPTAFDTPGTDAFAGTNVLSVVVEVPKNLIGGSSVTKFNAWLTSNRKS